MESFLVVFRRSSTLVEEATVVIEAKSESAALEAADMIDPYEDLEWDDEDEYDDDPAVDCVRPCNDAPEWKYNGETLEAVDEDESDQE